MHPGTLAAITVLGALATVRVMRWSGDVDARLASIERIQQAHTGAFDHLIRAAADEVGTRRAHDRTGRPS